MSRRETERGCTTIVDINGKSITIHGTEARQEEKSFTFDYVYDQNSTQQGVYADLGRPIVTQALDGFNGTIFAYGQTGSGKTHSMMGNEENRGIIPQLNDELWVKIAEKFNNLDQNSKNDRSKTQYLVTVSFLEVYNEEVKDLLNPSDKKLNIRESPTLGIFVEGLAELVSCQCQIIVSNYSVHPICRGYCVVLVPCAGRAWCRWGITSHLPG